MEDLVQENSLIVFKERDMTSKYATQDLLQRKSEQGGATYIT